MDHRLEHAALLEVLGELFAVDDRDAAGSLRDETVRALRREIEVRDRRIEQLKRELAMLRPAGADRRVAISDVLVALHAVIDAGIRKLYGDDLDRPWTPPPPRPPPMTAEQRLALQQRSIARARAAKRVGLGRGCVRNPGTKEELTWIAEDMDEEASEDEL